MQIKWKTMLLVGGIAGAILLGGCGAASDAGVSSNKADSGTAAGDTGSADSSSNLSFSSSASSEQSFAAESEAVVAQSEKLSATDGQNTLAAEGGAAAAGMGTAVGGTGTGSTGAQAADAPAGLNKKLIYRANVVLEVKDYSRAQSEVRNLVTVSGGYIVEFTENQSQYEQGGTIILKVPSSGFSSFLDQLEKLEHQSLQRSIQGQDVSEEYVDLESRLKVKQTMEARYLQFLNEATKSSQMVEFANELERIQTEVEQIRGRMRYIDQNVAYSTVEIRLYQPEVNEINLSAKNTEPLGQRAWNALDGSLKAISVFFQWLIVFLSGALPVLLLIAVIAAPLWLVYRKRLVLTRDYHHHRKNAVHPPAEPHQEKKADELIDQAKTRNPEGDES